MARNDVSVGAILNLSDLAIGIAVGKENAVQGVAEAGGPAPIRADVIRRYADAGGFTDVDAVEAVVHDDPAFKGNAPADRVQTGVAVGDFDAVAVVADPNLAFLSVPMQFACTVVSLDASIAMPSS